MNLRLKFLLFMVLIPFTALCITMAIAYRTLINDKTLFIYDNNQTLALSIAQQLGERDWSKAQTLLAQLHLLQGIVVDGHGRILAATNKKLQHQSILSFLSPSAVEKLRNQQGEQGTFDDKSSEGRKGIFSFIKLAEQDSTLLLMTPKEAAFRASWLFLIKSLFILIFIFAMAVGATMWFTNAVTRPLAMIADHTQNLSAGNFNICLPSLGEGEIGVLTSQFNLMVQNIRKFIHDREEWLKNKIEFSMTVESQRSLFPRDLYRDSKIDFAGFYKPNGNNHRDWWFYLRTEENFVICLLRLPNLGSQTPVLTSACRTTLSMLANSFQDTQETMRHLNINVCQSIKGVVSIDAIVAAINVENGQLTYTNTGLPSPMLFSSSEETGHQGNSQTLPQLHGPPLGLQDNQTYDSSAITLKSYQALLFHTQGLLTGTMPMSQEKSSAGSPSTINQWLAESYKPLESAEQIRNNFNLRLNESRGDIKLESDTTYFIVKWSSHAENL